MLAEPLIGEAWVIVATLRHQPGRPTRVQLARPAERIDIDTWSRSEGWCEHCRTRRARRVTYLLRRPDGHLAQVGSSCLAEFTAGRNSPRALRPARRTRGPRRLAVAPAPVDYYETRTYLAHVAQAVFDSGFVSVSAATTHKPATWTQATTALDRGRPPSTRADRRASQALAWTRSELAHESQLDDFQLRLVTIAAQDRLTRRELPTAAAIIYTYHQELRRRIAARRRAATDPHLPSEPR